MMRLVSNKSQGDAERSDNDLETPLLLPSHHTCTRDSPEDEEDPEKDEEPESKPVWLYCGQTWEQFLQCVVSILLPTLLTIQFRLALATDYVSHYPIFFLYIQIFFFGLAGWLYRASLDGNENIVIQLWPEIATDILLLLILYRQTATAVFLLDVTSLALAVHAAWNYWEQLDAETTTATTRVKTTMDDALTTTGRDQGDLSTGSKNGLPQGSPDSSEMLMAVVL